MKRVDQIVLIVTFLAFSWLTMQVVHELGHVAGALLTKAEVTNVALHPCIISRTDLGHNPHPLLVVWAGPLIGSVLPLFVFLTAKVFRVSGVYLFRFFAGFCLVANGVYMVLGPSDGAADTGVMMQYGSPRWIMVAFGVLASSLGLYLWNGQGVHFGLGEARGTVSRKATVVSALMLLIVAGFEIAAGKK